MLVAHRGNAADFPENTLPALASALQAGLKWVEFDVQLTADHVPFVIHDTRLERTTRASGNLLELDAALLDSVDAGEPLRFGHRFLGTAVPRLTAVQDLLGDFPEARAFVELKRASLAWHGRDTCLHAVLEALGTLLPRCVLLSFDAEVIRLAKQQTGFDVGWVLDSFDPPQQTQLLALQPAFVFYDWCRVPPGVETLPAGPWQWVAYDVEDGQRASLETARGAALIETMAPLKLMREWLPAGGSRHR